MNPSNGSPFNGGGFLLINKPQGPTSFDMVAKIRRKFGVKKVGHSGTLDPLAEGLLVIAVGYATRLIRYLGDDKEYLFEVTFGRLSETGDREGKIVKECENIPTKEDLLKAIGEFTGEISQTPPAFSAVKINGKRAYELARAGKTFEIKARKIKIYSLDLLEYNAENKTARFNVACSSGTYVRTLAQDIAAHCGSLGFCSFIRRTAVGNFRLEDADEDNLIPVDKVLGKEVGR